MGEPDRKPPEDELERLRGALEAQTRQCLDVQSRLDRAGAEFEEFISMAAHNLREPLREVASFSQLVAETYAGRLDPDAGVYLSRIREGAVKMQSLLTAAVDYWATATDHRHSSRTNMEAVLSQTLLSTEKLITERCAIVTHDSLPFVIADFDMLTKVLHHLIRNAIEYCEMPSPRVHVSSRPENLEWVFSVRDNGPGIDPAFQNRLFRAFKRLHGKEHPGNGLGLAFCKKVIECQGGRIWMESALGAGSTFYFALPAAD